MRTAKVASKVAAVETDNSIAIFGYYGFSMLSFESSVYLC